MYAGVAIRIKAVFVDVMVMFIMMIIITYFLSSFEQVSDYTRGFAFVFIFFLYDPTCTSIFGGTIGHLAVGIRVKRENDENKNIMFPLAILRFIVKSMLGWISLLTVSGNAKKKAIHDSLIGSVVLLIDKNAI